MTGIYKIESLCKPEKSYIGGSINIKFNKQLNMKKILVFILIFISISLQLESQTFSSLLRKNTTVSNVKDFGAIGNGTTDDAAAISAALTAGAGAIVYLPKGNFKISSGITIPANTRVIGAGQDITIISRNAASADFIAITIGGDNCLLEGFTIDGNSGSQAGTNNAVYAINKDYIKFNNIKFTDIANACVYLNAGCDYISFNQCLFKDTWYNGIEGGCGDVNHVKITNSNFVGIDYTPIYIAGGLSYDWIIDNSSFYDCGYRIKLVQVNYAKISNCHLDAVGSGVPSATNGSVSFEDSNKCQIINTSIKNSFGIGLELKGAVNLDIIGIDIYDSGGIPLAIQKSATNTECENVNIIGGHIGTSSIAYLTYIADASTKINFNGVHFQNEDAGIMFNTGPTNCSIINCQFNDISGTAIDDYFGDGDANNLRVQNNAFITCGAGLGIEDGDDMMFTGNKFITCTTPIDISDAAVVRVFIDGNMWYGCTNDPAAAGATSPVWGDNIDKDGGLYTP